MIAGVTRRSRLLNGYKQGVVVAVGVDVDHLLGMTRGSALVPQLFSAARPKPRIARFKGLFHAFTVHIGEHKHLAR